MVAVRRMVLRIFPNPCHLKIKNKIIPKAKRKPLLLLAKRREKVRKRPKKRTRKKPAIICGDSGAKKNRTTNQANQKKRLRINVGKKFPLFLLINLIVINLMI